MPYIPLWAIIAIVLAVFSGIVLIILARTQSARDGSLTTAEGTDSVAEDETDA